MDYCPEWYTHLRAAKFLGVAPWDLLERPQVWTTWATMAEMAEVESENQRQAAEAARRNALTPGGGG